MFIYILLHISYILLHREMDFKKIQSSPAISNSEGTGQKVQDSTMFETARLRDSEVIPGENLR